MATLSPEFWIQLSATVFTILASLAGVAYAVSKSLTAVKIELVKIETTVSPYGDRLNALEDSQSRLRDRVTKTETRYEEFDRLRREFEAFRDTHHRSIKT